MRQSKSAKKASKQEAPSTVGEYLERIPEPARSTLKNLRAAIRSVLPAEATEVISYRMPAFRHNGIVLWYAAFAGHCSLFPTASVIEQFKDELKGYRTSKGTIQFPIEKPLPKTLIKQIVKTRLAEMSSKK